MRVRDSALLSAIIAALPGCASTPPTLNLALRPAITGDLTAALAGARECENRPVAKARLSADFKYGCFCGKGHPALAAPVEPQAAPAARAALIRQYYEIKPIDDVDMACRDHDVCWVMHGEGDGECNDELFDRLQYIEESFGRLRKFADTRNREWRCQQMTLDMSTVFLTLFVEANYKSPGKHAGSALGRLATLPLQAVYVMMRGPIWAGDAYPREGERCILPPQSAS